MAKLYYGLHFKEIGLAADRRHQDGPTIQSPEHLRENLGALHWLMQGLRGRAVFTRPMGSIIVLRTQEPEDLRLRFDYRDALNIAFLAVRIGRTAVLASLLDWGAVSDGLTIRSIELARQLELHPYQFAEAAAAVAYPASKFNREFLYAIEPKGDHDRIQPILVQRGSALDAPAFDDLDTREAAEVQALFMGLELEDIYDESIGLCWTCLRDDHGEPLQMSLVDVPLGVEIITPLHAARMAAKDHEA